MRQQPLHIACALFLLLLTRTVSAQGKHAPAVAAPPPSTVKATVDRRQIMIGEPIQLMLEATVPGDAPLVWPPLDSLPHFDFVEKGKTDSVIRPAERYYRQYLTVTSFDSGSWSIPRLPFLVGAKKYLTDSVRVEVAYSKFDASKDYHDIKDIIDVPNPFAKWIGWIVAVFTVLSLALVIVFIRKKKSIRQGGAQAQIIPRLSPYEEAIFQLDEIQTQRLGVNGPVKLYYTRLNDILRLYVLRRLGISSLVETNDELIGQLRKLPVLAGEFSRLAETLRMSDFVKFAKYQPGISDNEQSYEVIRSFVEKIEGLERAREAKEAARVGEPARAGEPAQKPIA